MSAGSIRLVITTLGLLGLGGCLPLQIAEETTYREAVKRGEAPPPTVLRACAQAGTVRGPDGRWIYDPAAEQACLGEAGWRATGVNSLGQPTWTRDPKGPK